MDNKYMQQILTPTGYIPIDQATIGTLLLAYDVNTGELLTNELLDIQYITTPTEPSEVLRLSDLFDPNEFYLINGTWKLYKDQSIWRAGSSYDVVFHASDIIIGDTIYDGDNQAVVVTSIEKVTGDGWWHLEVSNDHSYIVDNLTLHNASRFWVGGTGTWDNSTTTHWAASTGGAGGNSVPGSADSVTLDGSSGGGTVTPDYDMTVTSITMGAFTGTLTFATNNNSPTMSTFSCSGTGTRTLSMGSGTWTMTGNGTVYDTSTSTNLTLTPGSSTISLTNLSGVALVVTCNSIPINNLSISAAGNITLTNVVCNDLDFTGYTGAWAGSAITVNGNLTLGSSMGINSSSGVLTMSPTSGTKVFTSNGKQFNRPITINATAGAGIQLADNLDMDGATARTLTLTAGTLDANNFNVTCSIFSSSNSNTRTLTMGSGTWTLTGNATTIWSMSTTTNLTLTGSGTVNCTYSGSTGTRTFAFGTGGAGFTQFASVNINAGTDTFRFSVGSTPTTNVDFTGFSGILGGGSGTSVQLKGDLTFSATMTCEDNATVRDWNFTSTSGTQTLTTNGVILYHGFFKAGAGGTLLFADDVNLCGVSANIYTANLTSGSLDLNNKNLTSDSFLTNNSNVRALTLGSGVISLTGTGTIFNAATSTNLTVTTSTSTINITDTTATSKTFAGGSKTYNNLTATGDNIIVSGSNTFNTLRLANAGLTTGLSLTSGTTQTVSSMTNNGSASNLTKLISTSAGTPATISKTSGNVSLDYMSIKDSTATGGAVFYAGANSTNVSGNTGWNFTASPTLVISVSDNVVVTEALVYYPDTVYVREFVQMEIVQNVSPFDSVTVSENVQISIPVYISVSDTVNVAENVSIAITTGSSIGDNVTVSEDVSIKINTFISVFDLVTLEDSFSGNVVINLSLFDSIGVTENITVRIISNPSIFDSVTVSENIDLRFTTHLVVYDTVEVTEFTDFRVDIPLPLITDSVVVTEFVNVNQVYNIPVVDTLTVSENFAATNMIWVYEPQQFAPRGSSTTQNFWGAGDLEGEGYYGGSPFPSTPYRGGGGL